MGRRLKKNWKVYIVRCSDGTFYTGVALDVVRRVAEHNGAGGRGAKYTRARRPVRLVHEEKASSRSRAQAREAGIKKLSRKEKEALVKR